MKFCCLYFVLSFFLITNLDSKKTTTPKPPSDVPVRQQFKTYRCNSTLQKKCKGQRKGFTKCFFGTTEKNVYCCNQTAIGNKKPGRNELFAPSICCVAEGYRCFSGTLCCGNGCTKQGKAIPSKLGTCSKAAPNDHVDIKFQPCGKTRKKVAKMNKKVCQTNTIQKDHDTCFVAKSPPSAKGPSIIAQTCCNTRKLKGKVPDKDEFVQIRACCNPIFSLCLFSNNCCSGFCDGLNNKNETGFCAAKPGSNSPKKNKKKKNSAKDADDETDDDLSLPFSSFDLGSYN